MLRGVLNLTDNSPLSTPLFWPAFSRLFFSQDKEEAQRIVQRLVDRHRKSFSDTDWRPWLAKGEFTSLPSAYSLLFSLAYFHQAIPDELQPAISSQPLPIFTRDGQYLRISRLWISACQQELGLNFVVKELITPRKLPKTNVDYANYVHLVHRSTYGMMKAMGVKATMEKVYRGAVAFSEEIQTRGEIGKFPSIETMEAVHFKERHIRCCSIKPHACENYDITPTRSHYFVLGRAMEETGTTEACVLPTVLFSTNSKVPNRYKGSTDQKQLLIFTPDRIRVFLRLFEIPVE